MMNAWYEPETPPLDNETRRLRIWVWGFAVFLCVAFWGGVGLLIWA